MTDWKGIVKNGWHPEKEGTSFKGQVKGLISRGDKSSSHSSSDHSAVPISTLRDPSSFGPPPRHVGYGSDGSPGSATSPAGRPAILPAQAAPVPAPAPGGGGGQTYDTQHPQQMEEPAAEPKPYRVNTTGLSTSHLPPPPTRRYGAEGPAARAPPPLPPITKPSGPPSLPPRLPPRSGNASPVQAQSPAPTGGTQSNDGYLNQGAINRLGASGISVPALGILPPPARSPTAASPGNPSPPSKTPPPPQSGQLGELQSRFSRLGTSSSSLSKHEPPPPAQGTTWAEKQAALKTAASFRKDPSSVSLADAKAAAGTAHNFHQRHGDQVASGLKTAHGLGQRFGVNERVFGSGSGGAGAGAEQQNSNGQGSPTSPMGQIAGVLGKKKPPPPPPAKKAELSGTRSQGAPPPPVPMGTRPKF
ncbi:hypothetical protein AAE478_003588 [Parahypoxylon ruwenzoriense]